MISSINAAPVFADKVYSGSLVTAKSLSTSAAAASLPPLAKASASIRYISDALIYGTSPTLASAPIEANFLFIYGILLYVEGTSISSPVGSQSPLRASVSDIFSYRALLMALGFCLILVLL